MKERSINMLNDETEDLIKTFSLDGKYRLLGSQALRAIQYGSDYDIDQYAYNLDYFLTEREIMYLFNIDYIK